MRLPLIGVLTALLCVHSLSFADENATAQASSQTISPVTAEDSKVTNPPANEDGSKLLDDDSKEISQADQSVIVANVLCQNIPAVASHERSKIAEVYSTYIEQVSELFGKNAKDIKSEIVGINNDHQMVYVLNEPISIVGLSFDRVNIVNVKGQPYNYDQITASKDLAREDMGLLRNLPQDNRLTVATEGKKLSVICNVKVPMEK